MSDSGAAYGKAEEMADTGNVVWFWTRKKGVHIPGESADVKRVDGWRPWANKADKVVFDDIQGMERERDWLKKRGKVVVDAERESYPKDKNNVNSISKIDLTSKSVLVVDRGLFQHVPRRLGRDFGKVYYFLDVVEPAPRIVLDEIGRGFDEFEGADSVWKILDKVDMVMFTDVYNDSLPEWLHSKGYKVFGSLASERLETDRVKLKDTLKKVGLATAPDVVKTGVDEVQRYLRDKKDKHLKVSYWRGTAETTKYRDAFLSDSWFDQKRAENGLAADKLKIMVEDPIDGFETGIDTFQFEGQLPKNSIVGYELKGKGYAGAVFDTLPKILADMHEKMAPEFKRLGYQGAYSNEVRITKDGTPYYLDCTARFPSPPSEICCEQWTNFSDAVWSLAHGELIDFEYKHRFGVQINLMSDFAAKHWLPVEVPAEIDKFVMLKNCRKEKEGYSVIPNCAGSYVGSVIAMGDDLDAIEEECLDRAGMVKGEELTFEADAFDTIDEAIEAGKKHGITF